MTTTKTIDTATANEILDLDLDPSRVVSVDLELGAIDACSRHLNGTGPRVVAYPRTATGMLGTGAHPGFVSEISESDGLICGCSTHRPPFSRAPQISNVHRSNETFEICSQVRSGPNGT